MIEKVPGTFGVSECVMDLQVDTDGNPILDQMSEEGFIDLTMRISQRVNDDTHYRFRLSASYNRQVVGMNVVLLKGIQSGFDPKMNLHRHRVYRKAVQFMRSGEESDQLVLAISQLYEADSQVRRMVDHETYTAIALHQGELDWESECVKLKIFGKDGEPFVEDDYYESFFNVDLANGLVFWNEKDGDYRKPLLKALAVQ